MSDAQAVQKVFTDLTRELERWEGVLGGSKAADSFSAWDYHEFRKEHEALILDSAIEKDYVSARDQLIRLGAILLAEIVVVDRLLERANPKILPGQTVKWRLKPKHKGELHFKGVVQKVEANTAYVAVLGYSEMQAAHVNLLEVVQ